MLGFTPLTRLSVEDKLCELKGEYLIPVTISISKWLDEDMEIKSSSKVANGILLRISHDSSSTRCLMTFSIFLPDVAYQYATPGSFPVLFYLSGLTCTDENACHKLGAFIPLAQHGIAMVFPDTSPRGCNVPGESEAWDFGLSAGFYIDATREPWSANWKMETYVAQELPSFLGANFSCLDLGRVGVTGHSMGGHGALTLALKHPDVFKSCSAFAPISNPSNCPWGIKAFRGYLGDDQESWKNSNASVLIANSPFDDILVDVGLADKFYNEKQLLPEDLKAQADTAGKQLTLRMHEGYGHDFYFYSTFIGEHVAFHAKRLGLH